ncbi:MAG: hypothetical protein ACRYFK_08980 [Janthinobacterium lividum]
MSTLSKLPFVALVGRALLAVPALAQKAPPTLLGRWETRQIQFAVAGTAPDSVLAKLDNPDIADLNEAIYTGTAHLVVEFRADSSYVFTIERNGQFQRTETGTFSLAGAHLSARSPGSPDGASFNDQQVQRLARRSLVLSFPMGPEFPSVNEQVEYRRVGPYPAEAKK